MRAFVALLLVAGCRQIFGLHELTGDAGGGGGGGGGGSSDAPGGSAADAPADVAAGAVCYGSGSYQVCFDAVPTMPLMLASDFDTDTGSCTTPASFGTSLAGVCFLVGTSVMITSVGFTGSKPVAIVAADVLEVQTLLEAGGHVNATAGPGALSTCTGATVAQVGGGGAGGSFMSRGGYGGDMTGTGSGGTSAMADSMAPTVLRGGCPGNQATASVNQGGRPGQGGGAVYLVAGGSIVLTSATIDASGGGGVGGKDTDPAGGGGGGTGGMIVLDAPMIATDVATKIWAEGGGGGGGASSTAGSAMNGTDGGDHRGGAAYGTGATGVTTGGDGYRSGIAATAGTSTSNGDAGGGGGGGAGYIHSTRLPLTGTIWPPPT